MRQISKFHGGFGGYSLYGTRLIVHSNSNIIFETEFRYLPVDKVDSKGTLFRAI